MHHVRYIFNDDEDNNSHDPTLQTTNQFFVVVRIERSLVVEVAYFTFNEFLMWVGTTEFCEHQHKAKNTF